MSVDLVSGWYFRLEALFYVRRSWLCNVKLTLAVFKLERYSLLARRGDDIRFTGGDSFSLNFVTTLFSIN
jgi:hypothetical protein